ncbi:Altered inheritance of mitochondria protein 32 [[Candida] zeylanoides]
MILLRRLSTRPLRRHFVDRCPPPSFDTGCTHCGVPALPVDKQIDMERDLQGTMASHWKHLLIVSPSRHNQWPSNIELEPGSLASELSALKRKLGSPNHPVMVSNADLGADLTHKLTAAHHGLHTVLLYPEGKIIRFNAEHISQFFEKYLRPDDGEVALPYNPFREMMPKTAEKESNMSEDRSNVVFEEGSHAKDLVLICGHNARDVRCGTLGPILKDEFDRVLQHKRLRHKVDVGFVSHIGGHAYAGNVLYFAQGKSSVWYGRVFPDRVQGIIEETIQRGNIIRELYRG